MLILSRRVGERILIGDSIVITVVEIRGEVRLGIEAPDAISIDREEIRAARAGEEAGEGNKLTGEIS